VSASSFDPKCRDFMDRRRTISLTDKKGGPSNFVAHNRNQREVEVLRVDGCCVTSSACDFLMLVENGDAFLIELKGSDVEKALKQINATLDALKKRLDPRIIQVRIVPSKVRSPNYLSSGIIKLRNRLGNHERFKCQARKMEENLP